MIYRTASKRIIQRKGNGRFRRSTLTDIGMGHCETCGVLFVADYTDMGDIIDPRVIRDRQRFCPEHRNPT
jgi:hypothetical protein